MKTTLHLFKFDTREPEQKAAWEAFQVERKDGPRCMGTVSADHYSSVKDLDGVEIELETKHLFDNQWNAADRRVFDYTLEYLPHNPSLKRGHWLEQTTEMREIRRNTHVCGYCGYREPTDTGNVFCPNCLDSEYLTSDYFRSTRMAPVDGSVEREPLTIEETAERLAKYNEAQLYGISTKGAERIAKWRGDIVANANRQIGNAQTERDGMLWLFDRGLTQLVHNNTIFYSHTGRFCFGWRKPMSLEERRPLLEIISEFQYPYDIKCDDK